MRNVTIIPALLAAALLAGCGGGKAPGGGREAVKVKVSRVTPAPEGGQRQYSGTVEEGVGSALSFAVAGTVSSTRVDVGDRVRAGQLLATVDATSARSAYDAARAALAQAEDAYRRMGELHAKGSLPEIKWTETLSKLEQARSAQELAAKNLRDCRLQAPFGGTIAEKSVEVGQNVVPGMTVYKLVTAHQLKVRVSVPETEIASVSIGRGAEISVPALGRRYRGAVVEKGVVANPLSRSYEVKLLVEGADAALMPGMVTEARLDSPGSARRQAGPLVIPASVVQLDERGRSFVWVVSGGKATKRVLTCGDFTPEGVIVLSGLSDTDQVIVEGQHKVCEGTKVVF